MPTFVALSLALQIACAVHVVRSGRPLYWIWILLIGSYLGVLVYVIAAVIPDLRNDPRSRNAARQVLHTIDPERRRRQIKQRLEMADTVDACLRHDSGDRGAGRQRGGGGAAGCGCAPGGGGGRRRGGGC